MQTMETVKVSKNQLGEMKQRAIRRTAKPPRPDKHPLNSNLTTIRQPPSGQQAHHYKHLADSPPTAIASRVLKRGRPRMSPNKLIAAKP